MPKDIRAGVSCKKEISQIPSPEGVQTSLSSPQVPIATFADSNSTSSNNECSASGTSPYATPCYSVASASNQSHSVVSYSSSSGTSGQLPGSFHQNMYMNTSSTTVSKSVSFTNQGKEDCNSKYSFGDRDRDHLIKVLTPSEIMKSLPDLKQDDCGFTSRMVRVRESIWPYIETTYKIRDIQASSTVCLPRLSFFFLARLLLLKR